MKTLKKLRLINWHLFTNTTTNIENITFLTGANGTGKSTIIDALQMIFLGDTTGNNFNKAANEKSSRTLMGYLRCETGKKANGDIICARSGKFSSYVAVELYDDIMGSSFTVGIVFDVVDSEKNQSFFYINDKFPENNFTNCDVETDPKLVRPLTIKELSDYCKSNYDKSNYKFFDTNVAYQKFIQEKFGSLPDKYFTLFKKAVGFKPISNISGFITEFVCDVDYKIDISPMQKNIEQYKLLELEAKKIKIKINELTEIQEYFEEYKHLKNTLASFNYVSTRIDFERAERLLRTIEKDIIKAKSEIEEADKVIEYNNNSIKELESDRDSYFAKKVKSDDYSLSESLTQKKNQTLNKLVIIKKDYEQVYSSLRKYNSEWFEIVSRFVNKYANLDLSYYDEELADHFVNFVSNARSFNKLSNQFLSYLDSNQIDEELLFTIKDTMETLKTDSLELSALLKSHITNLEDKKQSISLLLSKIGSGQKAFPHEYSLVREEFERRLTLLHSDAKVQAYCDLVDIVDKDWQLALESALLAQKANLFVNERYYNEASKLLDTICHEFEYTSIGLVDSERLIANNPVCNDDSVAKLIITNHAGARAYTDFLLGKVKKCDTFEQARDNGIGLTKDCLGYRNYATWHLNIKKGSRFFIGSQVDENTKFKYSQEYNELDKQSSILQNVLDYILDINQLTLISSFEVDTMLKKIAEYSRVDEYNHRISQYEDQLREGKLNDISELDNKIEAINQDIQDLKTQVHNIALEKGASRANLQNLVENQLPMARTRYEETKTTLETMYDKEEVEEVFAPYYEQLLQKTSFENLANEVAKRNSAVQVKLKTASQKLSGARTKYCLSYSLNYDCNREEDNDEFEKELNELSNVLLPNYQEKIVEAHNKAIKEFRDDFIYKLRSNITTVKSQIEDLNLALKDCKFGRDSYKFSVSPNKDLYDYYEMIMDDLLLSIGDATDQFLEKYHDRMESLFAMISDSDDSDARQKEIIIQNIEKFTDYRSYLVFDLLVTKGDTNITTSLAHTFRSTSGGESQTPFYISILASFAQLYRVGQLSNNDTIRLVMFDEAFSKMDAVRIKEACGLLKQFGLQAILSTPSEKLRDLVHEVDLILVAIHDEKKGARSYLDVYKDTKKTKSEIKSIYDDKEISNS